MLWGARVDGRIVARATHEWQLDDETVGWVDLQVHPEFQGRGIGRALADTIEEHARSLGRIARSSPMPSRPRRPGERLGSADRRRVGAARRTARCASCSPRGWRLEQVARGSRFALPIDAADIAARRAEAERHAGDDYRIHTWTGPTPERWLGRPGHAVHADEHRGTDRRPGEPRGPVGRGPRARRTTPCTPAGRATCSPPRPSTSRPGRSSAFTQLGVPADVDAPVTQEDTLVLREHRGHRLGMLLKVANLQYLERGRARPPVRPDLERRGEPRHARRQRGRRLRADRLRGRLAQGPLGGSTGSTFWQWAQKCEPRFMKLSRTIGRPQRGHGLPCLAVGVERLGEVARVRR